MLKTTYRKIWGQGLCAWEWRKLVNNCLGYNFPEGRTIQEYKISEKDMDKEVPILEILNSNGVRPAFWAIYFTQRYEDVCLILADIAESVLWIWERDHLEDKRPRECVEGVRKWKKRELTMRQLQELRSATNAARVDVNIAGNIATSRVACAVTQAVMEDPEIYDNPNAEAQDVITVADAAANAADIAGNAYKEQWKRNEDILKKYLSE